MASVKGAVRRHAALVAIFVLAMSLRAHHFADYPRHNQTADEYAWTWAGMTLLATGVPRSWSWLPGYQDPEMVTWRGNSYRMVSPWLDHPPLFALAMGVWMRAFKYRDVLRVSLSAMRAPMVWLFALQFWLLAALLSRLSDRRTMHLTLLVLAVCPIAVMNARLVVAENLFMPIYLALYLATLRVERSRWLPATAIGALALPLTKVATVALSAHLVAVAWLRQRYLVAATLVGGTMAGALAWFVYGHHYGPIFATVLHAQSARFTGFGAMWALLFDHKIVEDHTPYPLFVVGLVLLVAELRQQASFEWLLLVLLYAAMMAFLADPTMVRGWYLTPILPALCYGIARAIVAMWDEPDGRYKLFWLVFAALQIATRLAENHPHSLTAVRWSYLAVLASAAAFLLLLPRMSMRMSRLATVVLVAAPLLSDVVNVWLLSATTGSS